MPALPGRSGVRSIEASPTEALPEQPAYHRVVREVRTGVWHWEARHPEWNERQWWGPLVSSYAIDDGARLLLFDPLSPPDEIEKLAEERQTAIVLTCPWHRRESEALANRYGAPLYVPPPDEGDPSPVDGTVFREGDRLSVGVEAFPGTEPNDLLLWVESHGALVAGDTLQDRGNGLQFLGDLPNNVPDEWRVAAEEARERMQQVLALPVEVVLLTHGAPADRASLERGLARPPGHSRSASG
jgi:glyoxylase-like metal-dependent hydrolase (beta-lactamase superfamily II)